MARPPHDQLLAQGASPEEAAAAIAAIERFAAEQAPAPRAAAVATSAWLRAARREAVGEGAGIASRWADR